jgi:hypothetical protein
LTNGTLYIILYTQLTKQPPNTKEDTTMSNKTNRVIDVYSRIELGWIAKNKFFFLDENSRVTVALIAIVDELDNKYGDWIKKTYYIEDFRLKDEFGYTLSFKTFYISITSKNGIMFFYTVNKDDFDSCSTYGTVGKRAHSVQSLVKMVVREVYNRLYK